MKRIKKNIGEIQEYIKDKKVFCYGCGTQGKRAISWFSNWNLQNRIVAFADSNPSRYNGEIQWEGCTYKIIDKGALIASITEEDVLVISSLAVSEIEENLNSYEELTNVEYISLVDIAENQLLVSDYDNIAVESDVPLIPKTIHYCWLGNEMPDNIKGIIDRWHIMCPDYEIVKWDDTNYDFSKNEYMYEAYKKEKWGFVTDYMRLDVIYKYGGIYLDTDVEIVKKPDELLYQHAFCSFDATMLVNLGSGFGAEPNNAMIKEMRDGYIGKHFVSNDGNMNLLPCQLHQYTQFRQHGIRVNDKMQNVNGMNVYPMIFQGACELSYKKRITDKTFFVHYGTAFWEDASWKESRKRLNLEKVDGLINYSLKNI